MVSWTDVGVKGVRDARCKVVCLLRGVGLRDGLVVPVAGAGVVASMDGCPTRNGIAGTMSPCPVVGGSC